jgi:deoxyribodipyrimidine photo-lyase
MSTEPTGLALPQERLSALNDVRADPTRAIVLYWQVMARRTRHNFALEHAISAARAWGRPLVVLEALRSGYPWASDRLHRFALDGMADNAAAYEAARVWHLPYVEPERTPGRGLLEALGARACLVVTDEFPEFFLPRMLAAAGRKLARIGTRLEAVDGNGLLPMRSAARAWTSAPHFRRMLQRELPSQLERVPAAARCARPGRSRSRTPTPRRGSSRCVPGGRAAPRAAPRRRRARAGARSPRCPSTTGCRRCRSVAARRRRGACWPASWSASSTRTPRGGTRRRTRATAGCRRTCTGAS